MPLLASFSANETDIYCSTLSARRDYTSSTYISNQGLHYQPWLCSWYCFQLVRLPVCECLSFKWILLQEVTQRWSVCTDFVKIALQPCKILSRIIMGVSLSLKWTLFTPDLFSHTCRQISGRLSSECPKGKPYGSTTDKARDRVELGSHQQRSLGVLGQKPIMKILHVRTSTKGVV